MNDIINKKYNFLTIVSIGEKPHYVIAKCECGNTKSYYLYNIISGHTKSCGCFLNPYKKHGKTSDPLYKRWVDIKKRCFNEKSQAYYNYGGRGIIVCKEWDIDFMSFYKWAISNGWDEKLQIDRIDNNGNYEPSNCRFVSREVNCNNRRVSRFITYNGITKTMSEWARDYKISPLILCTRLNNNWEIEDALNFPIKKRGGCYNRYSLLKSINEQQQPEE